MGHTILESPAIVLNCYDHGESDKIVTFFCHNIGLLTGIAKGAHRSKKRFVNKLELFSLLHISYQSKNRNNLAFIHEAEHINSYLNLRKNIYLYNSANVVRELVLLTCREMGGDEGLFELINWEFAVLDEKEDWWPTLSIFLIRLPDLLGYRPNLSSCAQCQQLLSQKKEYRFHSLSGTLICSDCQHQPQSLYSLSHGTIKFIESARDLPLCRLHRLRPSRQIIKESTTIMRRYLRQLFQKDIHSWKVLMEMNPTS